MKKYCKITFFNGEIIELGLDDFIRPIILNDDGLSIMSAEKIYPEFNHHNGVIPTIAQLAIKHYMFYINDNYDVAYNAKCIVKIENI